MSRTKAFFKGIFDFILIVIAVVAIISLYVKFSVYGSMKQVSDFSGQNYDYVVVLGAGIRNNSTPTPMLEDRIITGVNVYKELGGGKLLMTGDSVEPDHDETMVMAEYAMGMGVDEKDIIKDGYGLSTYDSMWRARNIYGAKKIVIVTQKYHLSRALYIAKALGMEAYGVASDLREYPIGKMVQYVAREILARNKDFAFSILKPQGAINN